jgi:hypothetical protein
MAAERSQTRVECLKARDPVGDLGPPLVDDPWQFGSHIDAVSGMTPARDPRGILERDVEPTQVDQQTQMLDVRFAVLAIGVVSSIGAR